MTKSEHAKHPVEHMFTVASNHVAHATGKPVSFVLCCAIVIVWGLSGPVFHYSDTWQLIINTGTTIVTFLMVFLIQNTQNREGAALQAKLDEIIRSLERAENEFVELETHDDEEIAEIRARRDRVSGVGKLGMPEPKRAARGKKR